MSLFAQQAKTVLFRTRATQRCQLCCMDLGTCCCMRHVKASSRSYLAIFLLIDVVHWALGLAGVPSDADAPGTDNPRINTDTVAALERLYVPRLTSPTSYHARLY